MSQERKTRKTKQNKKINKLKQSKNKVNIQTGNKRRHEEQTDQPLDVFFHVSEIDLFAKQFGINCLPGQIRLPSNITIATKSPIGSQ